MNRMRLKIAARLKEAQNTNAMLTTFNELDMSNIMQLRKENQDAFVKKHGIKMGFMSAFVKVLEIGFANFSANPPLSIFMICLCFPFEKKSLGFGITKIRIQVSRLEFL
jgi:hypothetical protein